MTEREKLIDLIIAAKRDDPETGSFTEWLADYLLANGVTVQKWIPVSERLPDKPGDYLVLAYNGNDTFVSEYYRTHILPGDEGYMTWVKDQYACYPTHWMPLPEPPKEV